MADYNLGHVVGATGNGITSIEKISTSGLVDTYQINFTDGTSTTFEVTNGQDGTGGADIVTSWESTLSDEKIPSEKLTKNTIDTKVDKVTGKGLSTNDFTTTLKNKLDGIEAEANKYTHPTSQQCNVTIPSKISDLTNDSDFIETSSTSGLIKNDGTIDTSTYLTEMKIGSTSGLPVKTGSNGALTTGSFGTSAGQFAEGNHTHSGMLTTSDIVDNLTTSDATKVLSAKQGKALNDLIGAAITYINL